MAYVQNTDNNGLVVCQCEDVAGTGFTNVKASAANAMYVSVQEFGAALEVGIKGTNAHDAADTTDAPVKLGAHANAAEPAAVSENDVANISVDLYGNQKVVGNVAADAADRGCPVKVGGIANAVAPTPDENDRGDLSMDLNSQVRVILDSATAVQDAAAPAASVMTGGLGNAAKPTAQDEGDLVPLSVDLQGQQRVIIPDCSAALDAAAPGSAIMMAGRGNAAAPTADDEGDILPLSVDLQGSQRIIGNLAHSAVDAGEPVKTGSKAVDITALPADVTALDRADDISDLKGRKIVTMDEVMGTGGSAIPAKGVIVQGSDGTDARAIKTDTDGNAQIDALSTPYDATVAAAVPSVGAAVAISDGTNARLIKGDTNGVPFIQGEIAHDAADSGNPIKTGGKATAAKPAGVTEGDRVQASFDLTGQQRVILPDYTAALDAAAPSAALLAGGLGSAAVPAADDAGDIIATSMDLRGCTRIIGDTAHGEADTAEPVKVGAKATAAKASDVTEGDRANLSTDLAGQLRVIAPDISAVADAAFPGVILGIGGRGNAAKPTAEDEGDVVGISTDLQGQVRVIIPDCSAVADAAAPGSAVAIGAKGNAALPTADDEGDIIFLSSDLQGQLRTMKQEKSITLHSAGAVTAGANDTAVTGTGPYTHAEFLLNVTAAAAVAGDTLNVFVDASPDGGTTWVNVVHFTELVGDGGAKKYVAAIHSAANLTDVDVTSDLAAHDAPRSYLGNALRCRYAVVDGGAHGQSFNFVLTAVLKQS